MNDTILAIAVLCSVLLGIPPAALARRRSNASGEDSGTGRDQGDETA